jgi:glucose/arabinose dehydrogenase
VSLGAPTARGDIVNNLPIGPPAETLKGAQIAKATTFPAEYRGSAFATMHGSWNRDKRTGYKVVRLLFDDSGKPTGEYEDFMTGFVVSDSQVWGRPVGVAVANDGSLFVTEDGNGTIWRVTYQGSAPSRR